MGYVVDSRNWEVLDGVQCWSSCGDGDGNGGEQQQRGGRLVDGGVEGLGLVFAAPNSKAAACI